MTREAHKLNPNSVVFRPETELPTLAAFLLQAGGLLTTPLSKPQQRSRRQVSTSDPADCLLSGSSRSVISGGVTRRHYRTGDVYVEYDNVNDRAKTTNSKRQPYPRRIAEDFVGIPYPIDAVFYHFDEGLLYFFKSDKVSIYFQAQQTHINSISFMSLKVKGVRGMFVAAFYFGHLPLPCSVLLFCVFMSAKNASDYLLSYRFEQRYKQKNVAYS